MAAPTNVRVEAIDVGATRLRWDYAGAATIDVYRSTNGSSYSEVESDIAAATTTYDDTGLAAKTKYWYKLTDDNGSTFSSVVTVVTYVVTKPRGGNQGSMAIRQAKESHPTQKDFNDLVLQLETEVNEKHNQSEPCDLCIVDGAIVIDCTSGCDWFRVALDQDINSISLLGCDDCPPVDFIIPPNEEYGICGWPIGCDFAGDECTQAPITGGTGGRTGKTNGLSYNGYGNPPGIQAGGCQCPPAQLTLAITCCSDDCELACE
jgi:hypothetical protein